jgi:hypothetical protein
LAGFSWSMAVGLRLAFDLYINIYQIIPNSNFYMV